VQNLGDHAAIDVDVSDSVLRGNAIADLGRRTSAPSTAST
jgi:hypothetical protein